MQNAKHHEVDGIAVGVADGYPEHRHDGKAETGQQRVDDIQDRRDKQEQELQRLGGAADHAGDDPGDQQAFNFISVFRTGAVVHRQRGSRQAAEECRHFTLRQETGGAFGEAVGRRTAQLRLEDGQRAADAVAADVEGAAGFGKADQRHQNMVQAKRQQQSLAGAEDHRPKIPGAVDHLPEGVDPHSEDWPHQRDRQPNQPQHHGGDDRHEAGAAEEGQGVRQANVMEAFMQQPDDNSGDHRPEDPGID